MNAVVGLAIVVGVVVVMWGLPAVLLWRAGPAARGTRVFGAWAALGWLGVLIVYLGASARSRGGRSAP